MYSLLCELSLSMDGILVRSVLNDFDALTAVRLLRAVFCDHVQLTNVVLKQTNKRKVNTSHVLLLNLDLSSIV